MYQWSAISYKQRNRLLAVGASAFGMLAYLVSFQPTIALWRSNHHQVVAMQELRQAPQSIAQLQERKRQYDRLVRSFRKDSVTQEAHTLQQLTAACRQYKATLASLSPSTRASHNGYRIETRTAKLRGDFKSLVQVIYELEYLHPVGRISSVRFSLEEDRKLRRRFLFAYLYLQSINSAPPVNE